jgi:hypothetical protein
LKEVKISFTRPYLNISLCVLFALANCLVGQAQSGRRAPKPLSPPTINTPPPASQPPPAQNKPALKQQTLIVGLDERSTASYIPQYMSEAVWRGFIEKFHEVSYITLTTDRNMRRKQAIDRAKKETETFVVLLQLGIDNMGPNAGSMSPEGLIVSYVVFSPGTGKAKDQGRIFVRPARSVLGQRLPTERDVDSQLNAAGRETASRVMSALHNDSPAIRR